MHKTACAISCLVWRKIRCRETLFAVFWLVLCSVGDVERRRSSPLMRRGAHGSLSLSPCYLNSNPGTCARVYEYMRESHGFALKCEPLLPTSVVYTLSLSLSLMPSRFYNTRSLVPCPENFFNYIIFPNIVFVNRISTR